MHETKLKIDITTGLLEVEGSEQFVRDIYNDFKEKIITKPQNISQPPFLQKPEQLTESEKPIKNSSKNKTKTKKSSNNTGSFLKDLDLSRSGELLGLREFYSLYETSSNLERNLIFAYYLKQIREIENISIDHIFTCYRHITDLKTPGNLKQSIIDSGFKKGWLDTSNMENIIVPISGINYLEHDLPKKNTDSN